MSILTPEEEASYWAYEFERRLAEILAESMYLATDQHERRAAYIISEIECAGYKVVKVEK
jgi:hypothetical protein